MLGPHTLLVMVGLNIAAAVFFALTARAASRRRYSSENRAAGIAFTVSWLSLATISTMHAFRLLAAWTHIDIVFYDMAANIIILATGAMIAGFGYYVAYLGTGSRALGLTIILFAASHALLFLFFHTQRNLVGILAGTWEVTIIYEQPPINLFGFAPITYMYYFAPPILLSLGYLGLLLQFKDPRQRIRALTTGLVVFIYHAAGFVTAAPIISSDHVLKPIAVGLVVVVAVSAWAAQRNPTHPPNPQPALGQAPE
jgi:hypothetical protein